MVPHSPNSHFRQVKYYKRHKLFNIFLYLALVFVFSLLVLNISDIASSIITQKGSLFYKDRIKISTYYVYGVSPSDYNNFDDADLYSVQVKNAGGMGQVYKSGEYYVFAQIYPTLLEASEVQNNLQNLGHNAKVVTLSVPQIDIVYSGTNKQMAEKAFGQFREVFLQCYNLCIRLDKNEISRPVLQSDIASLLAENSNIIASITTLGLTQKQEKELAIHLQNLSTFLQEIIVSSQNGNMLSSFFKRQMFKIVQENIVLSQNLA